MPSTRNHDNVGRVHQAVKLGTSLLAWSACAGGAQARRMTSALPEMLPTALYEPAFQPPHDIFSRTPEPPSARRLGHVHHRIHTHGASQPHPADNTTSMPPHVSLVLPNFARPDNVVRIAQQVADYGAVDETLIWDVHTDPAHALHVEAAQTWIIRTPQTQTREKWGLMTRFKDCVLAQNEWVLITDDDQLLSEEAIVAMMRAKQQDPDRLVCYFARDVGEGHAPEDMHYRVWDPPAPAQVPICLTKAMLTDRRFCLEALRQAPMMEDIARAGLPYWNGEDIWHSLTAFHLTGKLHVVLPRDDATYTILPAPDGIGDARPGAFDHRMHRETLLQQGALRLGLNVSAMHLQPWAMESAGMSGLLK